MLTLFITLGLLPVFVVIELTAQRQLFKKSVEKIDVDWDLYKQTYD